ncbi:MAG: hypothetical protein ACRDSR_19035 [Pseudonocardiaceae bacterium]
MIDFFASWIAFIGIIVVEVIVGVTRKPANSAIVVATYLGLIVFAVWNSGYRQGATGQSIGRQVTRTKLV